MAFVFFGRAQKINLQNFSQHKNFSNLIKPKRLSGSGQGATPFSLNFGVLYGRQMPANNVAGERGK